MAQENIESITKLWEVLRENIDLLRTEAKEASHDTQTDAAFYHIDRIASFCDSADALMEFNAGDMIEIESALALLAGEDDSRRGYK
jgi:hypothetical protein